MYVFLCLTYCTYMIMPSSIHVVASGIISFFSMANILLTSQVGRVVKNPPASAGDARDADSKKREIWV